VRKDTFKIAKNELVPSHNLSRPPEYMLCCLNAAVTSAADARSRFSTVGGVAFSSFEDAFLLHLPACLAPCLDLSCVSGGSAGVQDCG